MALLGLVAFAGYQNRNRIADMLADARQSRVGSDGADLPAGGGFLAEIGQVFQSGLSNTGVSSALRDLQERFSSAGQGAAADSWISMEANRPLDVTEMEAALGTETLDELAQKTGLSRAELLLRLNAALPEVVDRLTPDGRLTADNDLHSGV
jgi:uncharacterized protein YidB (DUF937 family)